MVALRPLTFHELIFLVPTNGTVAYLRQWRKPHKGSFVPRSATSLTEQGRNQAATFGCYVAATQIAGPPRTPGRETPDRFVHTILPILLSEKEVRGNT